MKFNEIKEEILEEDILRVNKLSIGFSKIVPEGTNYVDAHDQIPPFGTRWGRGVLTRSSSGLDAIVGSYGTSHSVLKKSMQSDEQTAGTFYWGYDTPSKVLYLEYGSDRTFDLNDGKVLRVIIESLKRNRGPLYKCVTPLDR